MNGEHDPEEYSQPPRQGAIDKEANQWGMFLHLSQFLTGIFPLGGLIAVIVMWQMKKDEFPRIDEHGRMALNFQISMVIYAIVSLMLCFVIIGFFLIFALLAIGFIFPIIGGVKANEGIVWPYPLTIRFL